MARSAALEAYRRKRDFSKTHEPSGGARAGGKAKPSALHFVIQKHAARRLHYDFRLELDGVLKSWAVTKGPSLNPHDKRLAVHVEDHPIEYGGFEGVIPPGQYGAGSVIIWDHGEWVPEGDPHKAYAKGHLKFILHGEKLHGEWNLVRMRARPEDRGDNWLLIKVDDAAARDEKDDILEEMPGSVVSGKGVEKIGNDPKVRKWTSGQPAKYIGPTVEPLTPRQRAREPLPGKPQRGNGPKTNSKKAKPPKIVFPKAARKASIGKFVPPCLATAVEVPPSGAGFVHEIKFDGYRLQPLVEKGEVRIQTRRGLDWTEKFPSIAEAIASLPIENGVFDGEAVVEDKNGIADFAALQEALKSGHGESITFYVFDLLHLNGHDLKPLRLLQRKAMLKQVLEAASQPSPLRYSEEFAGNGEELIKHICRLGGEGIVSKQTAKPYRSGRNGDWLKVKCANRQEFVVIGYVPSTSTPKAVGSLVLGYYDNKKLLHAGRAGTGYTARTAKELFVALEKIRCERPPAEGPLPAEAKRNVRWVEPSLVAEIEFRGWTGSNMLRQAAFKGLREDKVPSEIIREAAVPDARHARPKPSPRLSVPLTHPDRLLWPQAGVTKQALADYYVSVWDLIAPQIVGRPLSLVRCPTGVGHGCFFQRHEWEGVDKHIVAIEDPEEEKPLISIKNLDGLIALVQASALEIHPWGCKAKSLDLPDRLIFDFDPGDDVGWTDLVAVAEEARARLRKDGIESFVKTSGGKGLHVVAPIMPRSGWEEVKDYCRSIAEAMAADRPDRLTATMAKHARRGRVYVDYLRNGRGATAVAAYSTRARPEAGVSMPLDWGELAAIGRGDHFTLANAGRRLNGTGLDPWQGMDKLRQRLPAKKSPVPRKSK